MYYVSAQGVDERVINVHSSSYYYYYYIATKFAAKHLLLISFIYIALFSALEQTHCVSSSVA